MFYNAALKWVVLMVAVLGVVRVVWNEFPLQLDDLLEFLLIVTDSVVEAVRPYLEEPIADLLNWVLQNFGIRLSLQYHWLYAYALLQIFLGNYAVAQGGGWLLGTMSLLFSLIFGILTGTVHLGHISVLLYPLAGFFLFAAAAATGGRVALLAGAVVFALAIYLGFFAQVETWFAGTTKSVGLAALLTAVTISGVVLSLWGFPGSGRDRNTAIDNPGRQMGLNILVVMFSAAAIISASLLYQRWNTPNPTAPRLADGGFYDCGETYCPLMKTIPAGTFGMGSDDAETSFATRLGDMPEYIQDEKPSHNVAIREFAMSITEVTREQFEAFIKARRYRPEGFCFALLGKGTENPYLARWDNPGHRQQGDHPAVCVTWWDAKAYADFLSRKTGHTYRLPSEAEWEYAARAGTTTSRYWGQSNDEACQYANVWDASGEDELRLGRDRFGRDRVFPCKDGYAFTAPVGKYRPNAFGIYDTLGNVWEWTLDCYNASYSGAPADGSAWLSGECDTRVFRGGSWRNYPWEVRSALRVRDSAVYRFDFVGFRVVRTD